MTPLVSVLLAAALVSPAAPPASAPAKPQTFLPYATVPGQLELDMDPNSFVLIGDDVMPMVLVDIQIVLTKPLKMDEAPALVKSYQNTLEVDCVGDQVVIVKGRAFGVDGALLYTSPNPVIVPNPHDEASPTTVVMEFICPAILNRNAQPKPVTKIPGLSA